MFDIGLSEAVFIALLSLLLFGPERLPEIGRKLGNLLGHLRNSGSALKDQFLAGPPPDGTHPSDNRQEGEDHGAE